MATSRTLKLLPVLLLIALAIPASASAQATRTWVSGVGDDVNPCSRTAPCKTFAGAISKTATGGIIMAMDDGGFGAVTITKPITIDGGRHQAGILHSGGINGVNINVPTSTHPNGRVVLKNLKIEGNGTTPGLNGVRITNARSVKLYNVDIGFSSRSGVSHEPDAGQTSRLQVTRSDIHDNGGTGINVAPKNAASARVVLRKNEIDDNTCGIVAATHGMDSGFNFNGDCAAATSVSGINGFATVNAFDNGLSENSFAGVLVRGPNGVARIGRNDISRSTNALRVVDGGFITSFGGNALFDNTNNGAATGSVSTVKAVPGR